MSQNDDNQDYEPHEERQASPFAGCLIFSILLIVFVSLGGFITYAYFVNKKEMMQISQAQPEKVKVADLVPSQLASLEQKLAKFAEEVKAGEKTEIKISLQDLNIGISQFEKMAEFKEKLYITAITPDGINADICFPVKAGFTGDNRYLNGTIVMQPEIEQGSLFPIITTISPNTGEEVIDKIKQFLPQALFSSYRTDPDLTAVFHKLSEVDLEEGLMIVKSDPNFEPADDPKNYGGGNNFLIGLSIVGILFFVFFSSGVIIYYLHKRSKSKKEHPNSEKD